MMNFWTRKALAAFDLAVIKYVYLVKLNNRCINVRTGNKVLYLFCICFKPIQHCKTKLHTALITIRYLTFYCRFTYGCDRCELTNDDDCKVIWFCCEKIRDTQCVCFVLDYFGGSGRKIRQIDWIGVDFVTHFTHNYWLTSYVKMNAKHIYRDGHR